MNVSSTSAFIPPLQIDFQTMQNLFTAPFTKLILHDNFKFSIHCQVEGLVEMRYVWKDPTRKILYSFSTFSKSFVTHSLKTSIISNMTCASYAYCFSTYIWISYEVFVLMFMLVRLIFQRQKMAAVIEKNQRIKEKKTKLKKSKKKTIFPGIPLGSSSHFNQNSFFISLLCNFI